MYSHYQLGLAKWRAFSCIVFKLRLGWEKRRSCRKAVEGKAQFPRFWTIICGLLFLFTVLSPFLSISSDEKVC